MEPVEPILETVDLSKSFGMVFAVDGISVALAPGEVVGIVGTNGSGKTTFLNLITGYLRPNEGRIRFQGRDITGLSPKRVTALGIARSFQIPQLYTGMSVLDNVLLAVAGRSRRGWDFWLPLRRDTWIEEVERVLGQFGFDDADRQIVANLPEGARKLLDVAVSFILRPTLLLMDEPTSGVSVSDKFAVMDTLMQVLKETNVTTVLIEHDMEIIERYADRALAFDGGQIIADGRVADVLDDRDVRRAILGVD